jgi:hypothetical protein
MFGWRNLSTGQRVGAGFLLILILVSGSPLIIFASSPSEMLQAGGGVFVGLGVLLNPKSFSQSAGALIDFDKVPKTCLVLYSVGIFAFCGGLALKHMWAA